MFVELAPYLIGAVAALATGISVYVATRKRDVVDDRSKLFDDALDLAAAHKESWTKATADAEALRVELALLRDEVEDLRLSVQKGIREGEMWRGVAVSAFVDYVQKSEAPPLWWPPTEPCPEVV